MQTDVRFFLMKLSTSILNRCLQGASFGKHSDEIRQYMRQINNNLPAMRAFKENDKMNMVVMQTQESIEKMAKKLADSDWENLSLILNLMEQVTDGQVLVVEKSQFDELDKQLPPEEDIDQYLQTPQL